MIRRPSWSGPTLKKAKKKVEAKAENIDKKTGKAKNTDGLRELQKRMMRGSR